MSARHEIIGHEGEVPFLGIWTSRERGIEGVYWCGKRTKGYAGRMFGRVVFGSRQRIDAAQDRRMGWSSCP